MGAANDGITGRHDDEKCFVIVCTGGHDENYFVVVSSVFRLLRVHLNSDTNQSVRFEKTSHQSCERKPSGSRRGQGWRCKQDSEIGFVSNGQLESAVSAKCSHTFNKNTKCSCFI